MAVVVPASSPLFALYTQIVNVKALVTADTSVSVAQNYSNQLPALQQQLVIGLMVQGGLPASAILSGLTFNAADTNPSNAG